MDFNQLSEIEAQNFFSPHNWMSLISNTDTVVNDVDLMLKQGSPIKTICTTAYTTNLINLKSVMGFPVYVKLKAKTSVKISYSEQHQNVIFDVINTEFRDASFSDNPSFSISYSAKILKISGIFGVQSFPEYLDTHKALAHNMTNPKSIMESLQWLTAQRIQIHNKPLTFQYAS
jgi:hypothetical protein